MQCTIFYSWQSDGDDALNRNFIEDALKKATKAIHSDDSVQVQPRVDKDTQGIAGSPEIADAIFFKIAAADVFVCDLTLINFEADQANQKFRLTPNPNVLIELGFALRALGTSRIILVMNTAFAPETKPIDSLPFDIRQKRVLTYYVPDRDSRAVERKPLQDKFEVALRHILHEVEKSRLLEQQKTAPVAPTQLEKCLSAIEEGKVNARAEVKRFWDDLLRRLDALKPDFSAFQGNIGEELMRAVNEATPLIYELSLVSQITVATGSRLAAKQLYAGFAEVLEKYKHPGGLSGQINEAELEFFRVCGCDMFLTFISPFVKDEEWKWLGELLDTEFSVPNHSNWAQQTQSFRNLSVYANCLEHRNSQSRIDRDTLQGHLIKERHSQGDLASVSAFDELSSADLFLFLYDQANKANSSNGWWIPWTSCYLPAQNSTPWLNKIHRLSYANQFITGLHLSDVETLRKVIPESFVVLEQIWNNSFYYDPPQMDSSRIGSRLD